MQMIYEKFEIEKNNQLQFIGDIKYTKKEFDPCGYSSITIEEEFGMELYPIIIATQKPMDRIDGILYELSEKEIQLADTYEGLHYKRIEVELHSNEIVWVYSAKV